MPPLEVETVSFGALLFAYRRQSIGLFPRLCNNLLNDSDCRTLKQLQVRFITKQLSLPRHLYLLIWFLCRFFNDLLEGAFLLTQNRLPSCRLARVLYIFIRRTDDRWWDFWIRLQFVWRLLFFNLDLNIIGSSWSFTLLWDFCIDNFGSITSPLDQ